MVVLIRSGFINTSNNKFKEHFTFIKLVIVAIEILFGLSNFLLTELSS